MGLDRVVSRFLSKSASHAVVVELFVEVSIGVQVLLGRRRRLPGDLDGLQVELQRDSLISSSLPPC